MQKQFKKSCLMKLFQNMQFFCDSKIGMISTRLHAVDKPLSFVRILNMHEFDTSFSAICFTHGFQNDTKRCMRHQKSTAGKSSIKIIFIESEVGKFKKRMKQLAGG